jgi:PAS domain S-box-containing protein
MQEELFQRIGELEKESIELTSVPKTLRDSEDRFRSFLDNIADIAYEIDAAGKMTYANKTSAKITDMPLKDIIGKSFLLLFTEECQNIAMGMYQRTLNGESQEYKLTLTNGRIYHFNNEPLRDGNGKIIGVFGIARDITARQRAEEELEKYRNHLKQLVEERNAELVIANEKLKKEIEIRKRAQYELMESEKRFRLLAENITDVIWTTDMDLNFTYFSPSVERLIGYSAKEALARTMEQHMTPVSFEIIMNVYREELDVHEKGQRAPERAVKIELELIHRDGSTVWTEVETDFLYDSAGNPTGVIGVTRNITERKHVEEMLRIRDWAIETSINGIAVTDLQGNLTFVNDSFIRMWGYTNREDVLGRHLVEFWKRQEDAQKVIKALQAKGHWIGEFVARKGDDSLFHVHLSANMIKREGNEDILVMASFIDISDWRKSEEALQAELLRNNLILQTAIDGFCILDKEGNILEVNDAMCKMFGYSRNDFLCMSICDLTVKSSPSELKEFLAGLISKGYNCFETECQCKNGRTIHLEASINLFDLGKGAIFVFIHDITMMKRNEIAIKEREKELELKKKRLEEANAAFRFLLRKMDRDRGAFEESVVENVRKLVFPCLENFRATILNSNQKAYLNELESNLKDIVDPFLCLLSQKYLPLTPTEVRVAKLIRQGKTTKEISELFNLSLKTIEEHRKSIRTKLGIKNKKVNLKVYLQAIEKEQFNYLSYQCKDIDLFLQA